MLYGTIYGLLFVSEIVPDASGDPTEELHLSSFHRKGQEFEWNSTFRAHIYRFVSFLQNSDWSPHPASGVLFLHNAPDGLTQASASGERSWHHQPALDSVRYKTPRHAALTHRTTPLLLNMLCSFCSLSVLLCYTAVLSYRSQYSDNQCWGKLLLKVMHYNIALLPKKVTNYVT